MCALADVKAIERDRDQLWAEAVHWYRGGFEWWLPPSLEAIAREIQGGYLEEDIWDPLIAAWLVGRTQTTVAEVLTECLGYALNPPQPMPGLHGDITPRVTVAGRAEQMRAANCLKRLGWKRDDSQRAGGRRLWVPRS